MAIRYVALRQMKRAKTQQLFEREKMTYKNEYLTFGDHVADAPICRQMGWVKVYEYDLGFYIQIVQHKLTQMKKILMKSTQWEHIRMRKKYIYRDINF